MRGSNTATHARARARAPRLPETLPCVSVPYPLGIDNRWDGDWPGYNITAFDVQPAYRQLLAANVSVLVYNGLRDTGVPAVGTEKWVPRVAGASLAAPRRKWGTPPNGAFAGHVTAYASGLSYATVAGAGHLVPADRPVAAAAMLGAFVKGMPLPAYGGARCKRLWLGRGYGNFCA